MSNVDRNSVRRRALCLCALGLCLPRAHAVAQTKMHRGYTSTADVSLRIFVPSGRVRIIVWDRDSIDIQGTIGPTASMFGGGSGKYAKFGVEPARTGDTKLPGADWMVTVPRKANVWVKMTDGVIDADGASGALELYGVGGSISVRRSVGVLSVESIDAMVTIEQSSGDIRLRGGSGPMLLRDVKGTASITSVSGRVTLAGSSAPDCRVETIGGDIDVQAPPRGATFELQTHSGAIGMTFDRIRLPVLDLASRSGLMTWNKVSGTAAEGRVIARSFKGAITVRYVTP